MGIIRIRIADSAACARFTPVQQVAICSKVNFAGLRQKTRPRGDARGRGSPGIRHPRGMPWASLSPESWQRKAGIWIGQGAWTGAHRASSTASAGPRRRGRVFWNLGRRICKSRRCPPGQRRPLLHTVPAPMPKDRGDLSTGTINRRLQAQQRPLDFLPGGPASVNRRALPLSL